MPVTIAFCREARLSLPGSVSGNASGSKRASKSSTRLRAMPECVTSADST